MSEPSPLGPKLRALRRRENMSQVQLAERLGISPSYLNLIEHSRRAMPAPLLIKVAQLFDLDLNSLSLEDDARLVADLLEVFGDPLFDRNDAVEAEVRDLAATCPWASRAVLSLYQSYRGAREAADTLAAKLSDRSDVAAPASRLPSEEVSDFLQRRMNHFPQLEASAEALWKEQRLDLEHLYEGLTRYLEEAHGVRVQVEKTSDMGGAMRRFDPDRKVLHLSEVLRRGSRNFQVAYQVGLLRAQAAMDSIASDPILTGAESRALGRVALANYFAAAVLMPYEPYLAAAHEERYDVELLAHRFRVSFEQAAHRLTSLRRHGAEAVPFHFVRIDIAGNISKRFSGSGLRFARFSGACPRWIAFSAFTTPGMVRTQLSQMPDGSAYFWVARTVLKEGGGYHAPHTLFTVALGCEVSHARQLVYADGVNLESREAVVPVGITCRLCERMDCEQRAFPPIQHAIQVDENVRGVSFFAPVPAKR